jgi:hypothetical protein
MFKALFDDARVASHAHAEDLANYELASEAAFLDQVAHAQDALLAELLAAAPGLIRAAAAQGRTETSVLDFVGPAKYSPTRDQQPSDADLCYLFLIKGPREPDHVEPLLPRLRAALAPFRVHHVWNQGNNLNSVVVSW